MLLDAHIPGLTKAKTAVVGIPRFDKYFKQSHNKFNKSYHALQAIFVI